MFVKNLAAGFAAVVLLAGCASSVVEARQPLGVAADIDAAAASAMAEIGVVPGLAVAVWTPEGTYTRGFGVVDLEGGTPVTPQTLFYAASSTKAMTGLAMAVLAERGEIDLDATLAGFAPDVEFPPAIDARKITLRSLLTHTAGIDNEALVHRAAYTGDRSPAIDLALLASATTLNEAGFGNFDYSNSGYNILTTLTDAIVGVPWQDLLQTEIFDRAGMKTATARISTARGEIARPYFGAAPGGPQRLYLEKTDATQQSAGGVFMSAEDALFWLDLMINDGRVGGARRLPAAAVAEAKRPQAKVGTSFANYSREAYSLGWYVGQYKGEPMLHCFGSFVGFRSHVSFLPDRRSGVAVFVNDGSVGFRYADVLADFIYDRLADRIEARSVHDAAVSALVIQRDAIAESVARGAKERAERAWRMTAPLAAYAGAYENRDFGRIDVIVAGSSMTLRMGALRAVAEPGERENGVRVEFEPFSGDNIEFSIGGDGAIYSLAFDGATYLRTR
jgi:CubicO group peptidase (beta-lactamase class C family)